MSDTPATYTATEDFETLADDAFKTIPGELAAHVRDVVIRIEEFPDDDLCRQMGLESRYDLLGPYHGLPMDLKSVSHTPDGVDMIFLYRGPILAYCRDTGEAVGDVVRHVLIHEIGHHFGFSDADMERIEQRAVSG